MKQRILGTISEIINEILSSMPTWAGTEVNHKHISTVN